MSSHPLGPRPQAHRQRSAGSLLTIAGIAAAGPATDALEPEFSVPDKEGWETNQVIAAELRRHRRRHRAADPGRDPARGRVRRFPGRAGRPRARSTPRLAEALPNSRIASYASTGDDTFVSDDGTTTFAVVYPQPDPDSAFGENPAAEKAASAALEGATVAGSPVHLTGFDALFEDSGEDADGPSLLIEALIGGFGALLVLIFVFASFLAVVPLADGLRLDHDHVPPAPRPDRAHDGLADRPVPDRADRPGRRDRLLAHRRLALARGAHPRRVRRRGGPDRDGDRRPRGRLQRHHGCDRPPGADRAAAPVPALDGLRRDADPARLDARRHHAPARRARQVRRTSSTGRTGARTTRQAAPGRAGPRPSPAAAGSRPGSAWPSSSRWSSPRPTCSSAPRTPTRSPSPATAKDGLVALEESGIGEGALLPHEILVDGSTRPDEVAADLREVEGVHGAVAPDDEIVAPGRHRARRGDPDPRQRHDEGEETPGGRARRRRTRPAPTSPSADSPPANDGLHRRRLRQLPADDRADRRSRRSSCWRGRSARCSCRSRRSSSTSSASAPPGACWSLVWQNGYGSELIWGIEATGSIPSWMPLMIFAFLFGLSMDYEVFILSRMREEYDRTGSTETAVIQGIGRTGPPGHERGADPVPGVRRDGLRARAPTSA